MPDRLNLFVTKLALNVQAESSCNTCTINFYGPVMYPYRSNVFRHFHPTPILARCSPTLSIIAVLVIVMPSVVYCVANTPFMAPANKGGLEYGREIITVEISFE